MLGYSSDSAGTCKGQHVRRCYCPSRAPAARLLRTATKAVQHSSHAAHAASAQAYKAKHRRSTQETREEGAGLHAPECTCHSPSHPGLREARHAGSLLRRRMCPQRTHTGFAHHQRRLALASSNNSERVSAHAQHAATKGACASNSAGTQRRQDAEQGRAERMALRSCQAASMSVSQTGPTLMSAHMRQPALAVVRASTHLRKNVCITAR